MNKTLLLIAILGFTLSTAMIPSDFLGFKQLEQPEQPAFIADLSDDPKDNQDWADLGRYNASDAQLANLPAGTNQVVFMGDSITDFWNLTQYFPGKPYINRGISGQTTPQMLVRFRPDDIELQPNVTIILAGTNDIAGNTGYETIPTIEGNLQSLTELAQFHKIKVILASLLPVCGDIVQSRPPATILEINTFIKAYAQQVGAYYLDYHSALVDENGLFRSTLTKDCLHPNANGYNIMAPLAQAAIGTVMAVEP